MASFSAPDQLRRREVFAVELRRESRSRQVQLKRTTTRKGDIGQTDAEGRPVPESQLTQRCPGLCEALPLSEKLALVTDLLDLQESNLETVQALRWVRRLFQDAGLGQLCARQLLSAVAESCARPSVELEASWALANLTASASSVEDLLTEFPLLRTLLQSADPRVNEHGLYILGNLLSNGKAFPKQAVNCYLHKEVVALLMRQRQVEAIKRVGCWVLSVFLRYRLELSVVLTLVEALACFREDASRTVQSYLLSAVLGVSHWEDLYLKLLFQHDLVRPVVRRMPSLEGEELMRALCVCVNISAGDAYCVQKLLDLALLDILQPLLAHSSNSVRARTLESLSNVAYGSTEQVYQLLQHSCFLPALCLLQDHSFVLKNEAATLLLNVCLSGERSHLERLLDLDVFQLVHSALEHKESGLLMVLHT